MKLVRQDLDVRVIARAEQTVKISGLEARIARIKSSGGKES